MDLVHQLDRNSELFDRISVDLLQTGYALRFTAQGPSMKPLIREGDIVLIEPIGSKQVNLSEIVFFVNQQSKTVLHRVLSKKKTGGKYLFLLKGDQVAKADGYFEHSNIKGRLKGLERAGSYLSLDKPAFKVLNWLAYFRSRYGLGRAGPFPFIKKISSLSKYLN